MDRKLLLDYIPQILLFRVMVIIVFLIRNISMKMKFYKKNVSIETFCHGIKCHQL